MSLEITPEKRLEKLLTFKLRFSFSEQKVAEKFQTQVKKIEESFNPLNIMNSVDDPLLSTQLLKEQIQRRQEFEPTLLKMNAKGLTGFYKTIARLEEQTALAELALETLSGIYRQAGMSQDPADQSYISRAEENLEIASVNRFSRGIQKLLSKAASQEKGSPNGEIQS